MTSAQKVCEIQDAEAKTEQQLVITLSCEDMEDMEGDDIYDEVESAFMKLSDAPKLIFTYSFFEKSREEREKIIENLSYTRLIVYNKYHMESDNQIKIFPTEKYQDFEKMFKKYALDYTHDDNQDLVFLNNVRIQDDKTIIGFGDSIEADILDDFSEYDPNTPFEDSEEDDW